MRSSLEKIADEFRNLTEIPIELRNYLLHLVKRCLSILDGDNVNLAALRTLSFQMNGALFPAVATVSEERRKGLLEHAWNTVSVWLPPVMRDTATSTISGIITGLITG